MKKDPWTSSRGLGWEYLDRRRFKIKSMMMYKILNDQSATILRNLFLKVEDRKSQYNLRSRDSDLALPTLKTNFFKA